MIDPNQYLEKLLAHLESELSRRDNLEFKLAHAEGACAAFRDSGMIDQPADLHWRARFRKAYRAQAEQRTAEIIEEGVSPACRRQFEFWACKNAIGSPQSLVDFHFADGGFVKAGGYIAADTQRAWQMWQEMTLHGIEVKNL